MDTKKLNRTFFFATFGLILIFTASASPIPTYVRLQERLHITTNTISMTAVCYFAGCIVALLVFSRLSDFIGRKKIGITTIILSMVGLILLINTHNGVTLLLARTVQGFSCGLGSSTLSVLIIESGINKNENLVSAIAGSAVLLGLAFGGFLSGTVAQFFSNSSNLTYILILLLLVVDLLGLLSGIETTDLQKGVWKSLRRAVLLQPGLLEGIFRPLVPQLVKLFLT